MLFLPIKLALSVQRYFPVKVGGKKVPKIDVPNIGICIQFIPDIIFICIHIRQFFFFVGVYILVEELYRIQ